MSSSWPIFLHVSYNKSWLNIFIWLFLVSHSEGLIKIWLRWIVLTASGWMCHLYWRDIWTAYLAGVELWLLWWPISRCCQYVRLKLESSGVLHLFLFLWHVQIKVVWSSKLLALSHNLLSLWCRKIVFVAWLHHHLLQVKPPGYRQLFLTLPLWKNKPNFIERNWFKENHLFKYNV